MRKEYEIIELTQKRATIITTIRALRNKKKKEVYRYIPVLNPLPWKPGTRVRVIIEPTK